MSKKGLGPFNRAVWNYIKDIDYVDQLSEEERQWYRKFLLEFYQHKFEEDPIDQRPEAYKEACHRENQIRRDVMSAKPRVNIPVEDVITKKSNGKGRVS